MKTLIKIAVVAVMSVVSVFADFNATEAESHFTQMTHEISKADHDMAERMCGVCLTKIKKYEEEMNEGDRIAHEYEIKTLETYKTRLQTFCLLKNEDYIR